MSLSKYDGKYVRIVAADGAVFDGECSWCPAEYCRDEYGRDEEALQIDDWLFFESTLLSVSVTEPDGTRELWLSRTQHRMHLAPGPFALTERGRKTVELRLWDEKRRRLRIGDVIRFESTDDDTDVLRVRVTELLCFPTFDQLYRSVPLTECGYDEGSLSAASPRDMNAYYSPEEQARWGVVGIRFELI